MRPGVPSGLPGTVWGALMAYRLKIPFVWLWAKLRGRRTFPIVRWYDDSRGLAVCEKYGFWLYAPAIRGRAWTVELSHTNWSKVIYRRRGERDERH